MLGVVGQQCFVPLHGALDIKLSRLKNRENGRNIFGRQLPALMGLVTLFDHGLTTHENFFTEEFHCFATRVCHSNLGTAENVILLTFSFFQFVSFFVTVPRVKQPSKLRIVKPVGEEEVTFFCNVKQAVSYTWYKNGKVITAAFDRYTVKKYRYLRIANVVKSDSGTFVCVASNPYGSANCTINFLVEGIGFFVQIFFLKV